MLACHCSWKGFSCDHFQESRKITEGKAFPGRGNVSETLERNTSTVSLNRAHANMSAPLKSIGRSITTCDGKKTKGWPYPRALLAGLFDQPRGLLPLPLPETETFHFLVEPHLSGELVESLGGICGNFGDSMADSTVITHTQVEMIGSIGRIA